MTALPAELHLGGPAGWHWRETDGESAAIPMGVLIDHGDHTMMVPWAGVARPYRLASLVPLTVDGDVRCPICGVVGRIEAGAWLPGDGGARGA